MYALKILVYKILGVFTLSSLDVWRNGTPPKT